MASFHLCADFSLFPDNTPLPSHFTIAGFDFSDPIGKVPMFVNATANEIGLQFNNVEICLPVLVTSVSLHIGAFNGPLDIIAFDSSGNAVRQKQLITVNRFLNIRILAPEIASLTINNAGNEGLLSKICVTLNTVP